MQTGRAIIIGAALLAVAGAGSAFYMTPRYSLTNPGGGVTVRLDRQSGDMMGCAYLECAPIVAGGKPVKTESETIPPPPPGFTIVKP